MSKNATKSPAHCPVTPDTQDRLAVAGLSSFETEGAALAALAKSVKADLEGLPDCVGNHGSTWHCEDCIFAAECATVKRPKRKKQKKKKIPAPPPWVKK